MLKMILFYPVLGVVVAVISSMVLPSSFIDAMFAFFKFILMMMVSKVILQIYHYGIWHLKMKVQKKTVKL